jgi:MinD-like ATPase involved in chromosome partitioning or flagellar assembly
MNKQINLIINGKGGVGKSFFATNFVQYLKDSGIAHCAIDSDHENSTLKRFHSESEFINLEHRHEIDRVFTAADTSDLLVIDCRAASTDLFIDFFDEVNLPGVLRSLDARLTVICPVNHEADSVEQLRTLSAALHDQCAWVVVKNEAHSDAFNIYDHLTSDHHEPTFDYIALCAVLHLDDARSASEAVIIGSDGSQFFLRSYYCERSNP